VTSETSGDGSPDPLNASEEPGTDPGGSSAPPTAPIPVPAEPAPVPIPVPAAGVAGDEEAAPPRSSYPVGQPGQPVYHTSGVYGAHARPPHRERGRRRAVITAVTAGALALIVLAVLLVVVVFKPGSSAPPAFGLVPAGSSAQQDGEQVAAAFLAAWESGDLTRAANYTDQPAAAKTGLAAYAKDLNLGKLAVRAGAASGAAGATAAQPRQDVAFSVNASVAAGSGTSAVRASWKYHSALVAYQKAKSSVWFVEWQPDVVAANVTAATHLAAVSVPPTVSMVTDAGGANLTSYGDAGLDTITGLLKASAPTNEGATAGLDVEIRTKAGKPVAGSQAVLLSPGNYPTLSTTVSAKTEAAARTSVAMHKNSSMVAIQPSTGKILAIANNAGFNDFALTADVAPGSTMKTITSTALFNAGLVTPSTGVACPASFTVTGITYHNDQGESEPAGTPFSDDFAQSCNNAFTQWWPHLSGKLAGTAKDYYGLNQKWDIGIGGASASYFNAPASASGSELAQEAFGEGSLIASPLAMASVAATIDSGSFKQPVLTLTAKQQVTAKPLPASTDAYLKQMMRDVVTEGTGAGLGLGPTVYAKTGTADIAGQDQPNSWMIAFDPAKDIAVACLVVNAGYGAQYAGPEVASLLKTLG
jgi:Penicillin binding protein transpeptidase domain